MEGNAQPEWLSQAQEPPAAEPPRRSARRTWLQRGLIALLVAITLVGTGIYVVIETAPDAASACSLTVRSKAQNYVGSVVEFEVFGPGGIGWECYAIDSRQNKRHIASLGLNPAYAELPIGIDV